MEMKYSINKLKGLFSIKKTLIYVLFILLLFIYFISASQGHSSNKLRFNFTFYFCFIQSIIAYLFTASELISYFRSGFDKLLYTYNFGIKKIIVHNFLYTLIYQIFITILSFLFLILYDGIINNFETFRILSESNVLLFYLNLLFIIIIILLIHYSCVLYLRTFIGNMLGISIALFFTAIGTILNRSEEINPVILVFTDIFGFSFISKEPLISNFILSRIFIISITVIIFYFALSHYSKNILYAYSSSTRRICKIPYLFYSSHSFFSLIRFHWLYIWQRKTFLFLLIILTIGLTIDASSSFNDQFGATQFPSSLIISNSFNKYELSPLLLIVLIIFIPLNLFDALRNNKFYRISYATPISNISIVFSIVITFFILFILCLIIASGAYAIAALNRFGIDNLLSFEYILLSFFREYIIFFFAGCGFILLYLILGRKSLAVVIGVIIYYIALLFVFFGDRYNHNWYLLSYFYIPELFNSDINPYPSIFQLSYFGLFYSYWVSLITALLIIFSFIYPRTEEKNIKNRIRNFKRINYKKKYLYVVFVPLFIVLFSAYLIISFHNKEIKGLKEREQNYEQYTKLYKKYLYSPQPEIINAEFDLDLFPQEKYVLVKGDYWLKNIDSVNIDTLYFTMPLRESANIKFQQIKLNSPHKAIIEDTINHFFAFILDKSLKPNDSVFITYKLRLEEINNAGYRDMHISPLWTLVESRYFVMTIGYGLYREENGGKNFIPKTLQEINYFKERNRLHSNRINPKIKCIISSPINQVIVSDGNLKKKWNIDSRAFYEYNSYPEMDLFNFSVITSSKFKKIYIENNGYKINVFYIPQHEKGAQGILETSNRLINNYTKIYGQLPYKTINIAEAASYRGNGGSSFGNSLVFQEEMFTYDFLDTLHINSAKILLAHEIAHFWFGGKLNTSYLPGASILTEGLAEYSAMEQLKNFYPFNISRKYIEIILKRASNYEDSPLNQAFDDKYALYYKAPASFRRISMEMGNQKFDTLLRNYINISIGKFVSLQDFIYYLQSSTLKSDSVMIDELFLKNIQYYYNIKRAKVIALKNNKVEVNVDFQIIKNIITRKTYESYPINNSELIDITFLKKDKIIHQEELNLNSLNTTLSFNLNEAPDLIVLDYKFKFINKARKNYFELKD